MLDSLKTFLCRRCKVPAQIGIEDGDIAFMRCPRCGMKVEGEIARRMYIEQAQYVNRKAVQDMFRRALSGGQSGGVSSSHQPTHLKQPSGEFVIESED